MKLMSCMTVVLLLTVSLGAFFGLSTGAEEGPFDGLFISGDSTDVPTWMIGTYWTYHQHFWVNSTDEDEELYLEERLTYTVSSIEHMDIHGIMTPVYVLELEGEILDGSGSGAVDYNINEGHSQGHTILRMDDLGEVTEYQYKYMEGRAGLRMTITMTNTNTYSPVVENYDFPLIPGGHFWANNTFHSQGYTHVTVGIIVDTNETHDESMDIDRAVHIHQDTTTVDVPAGSFETMVISEELGGEEEGSNLRYYDQDVQNYVKQVVDNKEVDWIRVLEDYHVPENPNSMTVTPVNGSVGDTVTISGTFPNHGSETVSIRIPMAGFQQDTTTDAIGAFSVDIEIPYVQDNTPSPGFLSKVGLIAEVGDYDAYQAASIMIDEFQDTLSVSDPIPAHGENVLDLPPELSVHVEHSSGMPMEVTFYDASDNSVIGVDEDVQSGARAYVTWNEVELDNEYRWYAIARDGVSMGASETWRMSTFEAHTLTIDVHGEGTVVEDPHEAEYDHGMVVTLTAVPADGWEFVEWSGDHVGTEEQINITMDSSKHITANFQEIPGEDFELVINVNGQGATYPLVGTYVHPEGTVVTIAAFPEDDWEFSGWTGDHTSMEEQINITMDGNKSVTANFREITEIEYVLTVISSTGGAVVEPGEGSYSHVPGSVVDLVAVADPGYEFVRWSGDTGTVANTEDHETTVTMDDNYTITAEFKQEVEIDTHELTVGIQGEGTVEVDGDMVGLPYSHEYDHGAVVTLRAIPATGWEFVEWTGHAFGANTEVTLTMDGDKSVTGVFEEIEEPPEIVNYTLTLDMVGEGTTDPSVGSHTYEDGTTLTITATPSHGWKFVEWTGDHTGTSISITVTMDDNKTITAVFEEEVKQDDGTGSGDDTESPGLLQEYWWALILVIIVIAAILLVMMKKGGGNTAGMDDDTFSSEESMEDAYTDNGEQRPYEETYDEDLS